MATTPRVVFSFCGRQVEVGHLSTDRRGAFRALAREAESKLDVFPESYNLFHKGSKVDSLASLQSVLQTSDDVCLLDVCERPEWKWKKMREMDAQIKALKAKEVAFDAALHDRDERIMAKVEASLKEVRDGIEQNSSKLCNGLAPVVQTLAMEQIDLKLKLDKEMTSVMQGLASQQSVMTAKIDNVLAPMVQRLSMEQIELKNKLASIDVESAIATCQGIVKSTTSATGSAVILNQLQEQQSEIIKSIEDQQLWNNDVELALGLAKESQESLGYEMKLVSANTQSAILQTNKHFGKWCNDVEMVLGRAKENEESLGYELQLLLERTRSAEEGLKELKSQVQAAPEATKLPQQENIGSHVISSELGTMFPKDDMVSFAYSRKGPHIKPSSRVRLPWESAWSDCHVRAVPFVQLHNQRCQSMPQLPPLS